MPRPFFSYYGSKWRLAPKYPSPKHSSIVEPFAGSAGYSLRFPYLKVELYDLDPTVCGVWDYLIKAKKTEILKLPDIKPSESTEFLKIPQEARDLIGFWLNKGSAYPKNKPSKWMISSTRKRETRYWGQYIRERIANQLEHIRHWSIEQKSFLDIELNKNTTWFIDPPYTEKGHCYRCGSSEIDYLKLAQWCKSRNGQVIVCEQARATWLPFQPLALARTAKKGRFSKEVVWCN